MLKTVYEVEFNNEIFKACFDPIEGIRVEGYDAEAQFVAETMSQEIGMGQFLRVLSSVAKERGEEGFASVIEEWKEAATNKGVISGRTYRLTNPIQIAAAAVIHKDHYGAVYNHNTHPITLAYLSRDKNAYTRKTVAKNKSTSTKVLKNLLEDSDPAVVSRALRNAKVPIDILQNKAQGSERERRDVVNNPATPYELIRALLVDASTLVRRDIAKLERINHEDLLQLMKDPSPTVRKEVAFNKSTTPDMLAILLTDRSKSVTRFALMNPNAREEDILNFVKTRDFPANIYFPISRYSLETQLLILKKGPMHTREWKTSIAMSLARTSQYPEIHKLFAHFGDPNYHYVLAGNPHINKEIQQYILMVASRNTATHLAINPNLDPKIQIKLARSRNQRVRDTLARNYNICEQARNLLVADTNASVSRDIASNPHLTYAQKLTLVTREQDLLKIVLRRTRTKDNRLEYARLENEIFTNHPSMQKELARYARSSEAIKKLVNLRAQEIDDVLLLNKYAVKELNKRDKATLHTVGII